MRVGMMVIYGLLVGCVSASAQAPAGAHLYGRVTTAGGAVHEGWIRWGVGAAAEADLLEGVKAIPLENLAQVQRIRAASDPEADLAARSVVHDGVRITWEVDDRPGAADTVQSGIRFAHLRSVVSTGERSARLLLRTGDEVELSARSGADAFVSEVRVQPTSGTPVELEWAEVARLDLLAPPPSATLPGRRLHGTVEVRGGTSYSGYLELGDGRIYAAEVVGGARAVIPPERIVSLRRGRGGSALVTLEGGEERSLPGALAGRGGVVVSDPRLGTARIPWSRIEVVRLHAPDDATATDPLESAPSAARLHGTAVTRSGERHTGLVRWDNDEAYAWEILNGSSGGSELSIELGQAARIDVSGPSGVVATLRDGRTFSMSGSNDVGIGNRGVVIERGSEGPAFVDWLDLEALVFDEAAPLPSALRRDPPTPSLVATAFDDPGARTLHGAGRDAAFRVQRELLGYTAVVRQRAGVDLRLPLRDRTLYRQEGASRVFWSRDGGLVVQVLAGREVEPGSGAQPDVSFDGDMFYDPARSVDRLTFGLIDDTDDEAWFHHPLGIDAEEHYRFRTGDTLTLSLPDGRSLRAVELQVIPREADYRRVSGSLWIEPGSGALVRAVYRMSEALDATAEMDGEEVYIPGIFQPFTGVFTMATVDYTLWDFRVWLPRSMRIEGIVRAGIIQAPAAIEVSYRMESVDLEGDLAAEVAAGNPSRTQRVAVADAPAAAESPGTVAFRTRSEAMARLAERMGEASGEVRADSAYRRLRGRQVDVLRPTDPQALLRSPELPPPVWEEAPGFMSDELLSQMERVLAGLPTPAPLGVRWAFNWGHERPDLLRYNRVEALAVGARAELLAPTPIGPVTLRAEPFFGVADRSLKARLTVERETLRRKVALGAYRELQTVSARGSHLGLGNSVSALLFGRDDGEYFLATGVDLRVTPPSARRSVWDLRLYAERHAPVETNSSFALSRAFDGDWSFRPNVGAERVDEWGASLLLSPWWGTDPLAPQGGVELLAHGAGGDREYARGSVTLRGTTPLFGRLRLGAEAGAGESWGDPPLQRSWFLGGSHTLRGYDPSVLVGPSFARARLDLQRTLGAVGLSLFGDAGWAGDGLDAFAEADALASVGAGFSILGGVIRFDVARALRNPTGWRVHLYLDGIH